MTTAPRHDTKVPKYQVTKVTCLQAGAVDDLHVDSELATVIVENNDTNGATAGLESLVETSPEVGLVNDWDRLLDITLRYVSIVYVYCLLWGCLRSRSWQ